MISNPNFKDDILYSKRAYIAEFVNTAYSELMSNSMRQPFKGEVFDFLQSKFNLSSTEWNSFNKTISLMMPSFTEDLNDYFIGFPLAEVVDKDYFIKIFTIFNIF